jgi:hypothetical protein
MQIGVEIWGKDRGWGGWSFIIYMRAALRMVPSFTRRAALTPSRDNSFWLSPLAHGFARTAEKGLKRIGKLGGEEAWIHCLAKAATTSLGL